MAPRAMLNLQATCSPEVTSGEVVEVYPYPARMIKGRMPPNTIPTSIAVQPTRPTKRPLIFCNLGVSFPASVAAVERKERRWIEV